MTENSAVEDAAPTPKATKTPNVRKPAAKKPVAKKPAAKKPAAKKKAPAKRKPAAKKKPVTRRKPRKPAAKKPAVKKPLADRIADINSWDDVKDIANDGIDGMRDVTMDDVMETGKGLLGRIAKRVAGGVDEATRKD